MRTEMYDRPETMYRNPYRKPMETKNVSSESRPAFMVNPPVIITLNDDMAQELATFLRKVSTETNMPPFIFAFMRHLENDLQQS